MKQVLSKLNLGDIVPYPLSVLIELSSTPAVHVLDYLLGGEPITDEELMKIIRKQHSEIEEIFIEDVDILNNKVSYSAMLRDLSYVPKVDKDGNEISKEYYLSITVEEWNKAKLEKSRDLYTSGPKIRTSTSCKIWR